MAIWLEELKFLRGQPKDKLPPSYGKKVYTDLSEEEKEVVNSFQGEEAYNEVMNNVDYFLAPVTKNNVLMIGWLNVRIVILLCYTMMMVVYRQY